jgi:hypothetical protein
LGEVGQQVKAIGAEPLVLELDLMAPTAVPHVRRTPERLSAFSDGVFTEPAREI